MCSKLHAQLGSLPHEGTQWKPATQVDLVLIERLLRYICGIAPYDKGSHGSEAGAVKGAVLVFLPVLLQTV